MATIDQASVDAGKLEQFVFRAVEEVGATLNAALVVMGDQLGLYEDNLNPIGRAYYGFSTLPFTSPSLSQDVGPALGAQAGKARLREVVTGGGFTRFRRATETPFNLVVEARP